MTGATARCIAVVAGLAALYIGVARFGLGMDAVRGFAALVWPATGLSLAALLVVDPRAWPGVTIGAFVVNSWTGAPFPVALGIAAGNTLEAVAAAHALRRFADFHPSIDRLRDALAFIAMAALGSTMLSASVGVASLVIGGIVPLAAAGSTWRAWWLGDVMGDSVVAPLLLTLVGMRASRGASPRRMVEAAALEAAVLGAAVWLFGTSPDGAVAAFRGAYMIFPFLVWAALRFGSRGAAVATFSVCVIAITGTALGRGPFLRGRLSDSLLFLQVFMAIAAMTTLILGAIAQERRAALALRDSLLSVASHELRTPLSALQLRAQILTRGINRGAAPAERLASDALGIERQVKRLSALVDDLLDVSRIMAGRMRLELEQVDLGALVAELVERFSPEERARVRVVAPAQAIVGHWDRTRIDQVVTNLVTNGLKYGGEGPVEVALACGDESARIVVQDWGIGIPAEDMRRIFGRFERGRTPKTATGFGLGLWIVAQIVDAAGGTIAVESEPGKGSTFTVELPLGSTREPRRSSVPSSVLRHQR